MVSLFFFSFFFLFLTSGEPGQGFCKGWLSCHHSPTIISQQWLLTLSIFFLSCCPSPHSLPSTLPFPSRPTCLPLERSRSWRQHAGVPAGSWELSLPKHFCLSEFISSGMSHTRELRSAFGFKFVQKVGMSLFRFFIFLFLN